MKTKCSKSNFEDEGNFCSQRGVALPKSAAFSDTPVPNLPWACIRVGST